MSKRLQVVLPEELIEQYRECARHRGMSLSEWARQALDAARREQTGPSVERKLRALERALACGHPTGEVDEILREIEAGRGLR